MSLQSSKKILGVRVDNVNWSDIDQFCLETLHQDEPKQIVTVNGEFILDAQKNERFKNIINNAGLVIPDSTNVTWFGRLKATTPGSDLTVRLCQLAVKEEKAVYLLGGWNDVPQKAAQKLQKLAPGLKVAGYSDADPGQEGIAQAIKASNADIVFVAYAAPNQEYWIDEHKNETGAKILIGVGGTFNMLAGTLPRAPKFFRITHFEWLWRLVLEPKRWKRIWRALVVFPLTVLLSH